MYFWYISQGSCTIKRLEVAKETKAFVFMPSGERIRKIDFHSNRQVIFASWNDAYNILFNTIEILYNNEARKMRNLQIILSTLESLTEFQIFKNLKTQDITYHEDKDILWVVDSFFIYPIKILKEKPTHFEAVEGIFPRRSTRRIFFRKWIFAKEKAIDNVEVEIFNLTRCSNKFLTLLERLKNKSLNEEFLESDCSGCQLLISKMFYSLPYCEKY